MIEKSRRSRVQNFECSAYYGIFTVEYSQIARLYANDPVFSNILILGFFFSW